MNISLVSTVFNENDRLDNTIQDIENQTVKPTEIIITDAGSFDGTYEKLLKWKEESSIPIVILLKERCNVAEGRNMAIRAAKYDIIASTDFGCRFNKGWLESITNPLKNPETMVVGGSFSVIESEQNSLAAKAAYINSNGYKFNFKSPNFIPSSRSIAYRKEVFNKVGGYCEWLTLAGDDFIFGLEVRSHGYRFHIVDEPNVFWGRHILPIGFLKEAGRYGLGEGEAKANKVIFYKHVLTLTLQLIFTVLLLVNIAVYWINGNYNVVALLANAISIVGFKSYFSVFQSWLKFKSKKYNFRVLIFAIYQQQLIKWYYIKGYIKGYFKSSEKINNGAAELHKRLDSIKN